ncbi:MAG: thioesterase [Deltaproteobacteria bacterium]|nr:MAG: thioesterase [Deltaproteobacteria bacterium]
MSIKVAGKQPNSNMCFVCGLKNSFGLKAEFFELENGDLVAVFRPAQEHQGYPGRLHGGLSATILDETIGRAITCKNKDIWGVTIDFSVRFRRPVPLDEELRVAARVVKDERRGFEGTGEILTADGQIAVEGRGRYLKMELEKIADFDHESAGWQVYPKDTDYDSFDL